MTKASVLFVDDDKNVLSGLRRSLRSQRSVWDMTFAHNALEAIELLDREQVDVIVSDMRMPDIDGAELLEQASHLCPGTIRFVLSGQSHRDKLLQVVSTAHQFHSKPCDSDSLVATINKSLQTKYSRSNGSLGHLALRIRSLPSQASSKIELDRVLSDPALDTDDIFNVLKNDIGLTTKILQLVNSSFFDSRTRLKCLSKACHALGKELLHDLFYESDAFQFAEPGTDLDRFVTRVSQHCICVAESAQKIAMLESDDTEFHEVAFLSGLLHNVGKLVFASREDVPAFVGGSYDPTAEDIQQLEQRLFGVTHDWAGFALLHFWGFDSEIANVCLYHGRPAQSEVTNFGLLACVYVADCVNSLGSHTAAEKLNGCEFIQSIDSQDRVSSWIRELYS